MQLREYIQKSGIIQGKFAKQIGIGQTQFSFFIRKKRPLNACYWSRVVKATKGAVTIKSLLKEYEQDYANRKRHIKKTRAVSVDFSDS